MVYGQHVHLISGHVIFIYGVNLKDKVCKTNPYTIEELKETIQKEIKVPHKELLQTNSNLFKRYIKCVYVHGQHFQHILIEGSKKNTKLQVLSYLEIVLSEPDIIPCK
jgi:hypothetical protein